jgi:hypothetical protein
MAKVVRLQKKDEEFAIDSNIPPPPRAGRTGTYPKYPFAQMKVGDSFSFGEEQKRALLSSVGAWKARHPGWNYTVRGYRVWRTA